MSQRTVNGVINNVSAKDWPDQRTGQTIKLYSFQLEGSYQWFRTGTNPLPAGKGQSVKFVADGPNVDMQTFEIVQGQVTQAPSVSTTAVQSAPATSAQVASVPQQRRFSRGNSDAAAKDQYWKDKEARDLDKDARYRAVSEPRMAMSVAVQAAAPIIVAALGSDALSLGNAAKAKKLGLIADYTKELATDLARFIQNAPEVLAAEPTSASSASSVSSVSSEGQS